MNRLFDWIQRHPWLSVSIIVVSWLGTAATQGAGHTTRDVASVDVSNGPKICTIDAHNPGPKLRFNVERAAAFMRARGYNVPATFELWVGDDEQLRKCVGAIAFVDDDGMTLSRTVANLIIRSDVGGHYVLRHELAHTVSDMTAPRGQWTQGDRDAAEGAADAAATDTEIPYRRHVLPSPDDVFIGGVYVQQERMVRGMSQRATGRPVGHRDAVAWRRAYLNAGTAQRRTLWEAANDRHRTVQLSRKAVR